MGDMLCSRRVNPNLCPRSLDYTPASSEDKGSAATPPAKDNSAISPRSLLCHPGLQQYQERAREACWKANYHTASKHAINSLMSILAWNHFSHSRGLVLSTGSTLLVFGPSLLFNFLTHPRMGMLPEASACKSRSVEKREPVIMRQASDIVWYQRGGYIY